MSRFSSLVRLFVLVLILTLLTVTLNIQAAPDLTAGAALPMADTEAPISAVEALPEFSKEQVTVKWSGYDPGGSGIQAYDVQYRDVTASSAWTDWQIDVVTTTASFTGTTGRTYAFRSRALDYAQNQEDWPAGDGDAHTTFYAWAITGTAHTNTGSPLAGVNVTTEPSAQGMLISDLSGQYSAYVITPSNTYTVSWAKDGYGHLPATTFRDPASTPIVYQGTLPAQGNVVTVGGLEVGQTYRIVVTGTFEYTIGGGAWADAQWSIAGHCTPGVFCYYSPNVDFNGVLLAAQNGQDAVDPSHEYTFLWTADTSQLQMHIMDALYSDNSGSLSFEVSRYDATSDPDVFLPPANDLIRNGHFEQGTGAINNWMASGVSTPTVSIAARHTGRQSALLKAAPSLENGLVSYWKLDEATGNALDVLGTNPLTATNAPGSTVGMVQGARTFSGDHQYFSIPTRPSVEVGDTSFTFTAWVSMTDKANHRNFVGKQIEITETDRDYSLYYDINFDRFIFQVAGPDGVTLTRAMANSLGSPAANVWYFLAGGYDAARGYVWISVNGDLRETTPFTGNAHVGQAPFMLGAVDNPYYGYHSGWMDEVGFWKRALTSAEVAALYNNGQGLAYPFNTSAGGTAIAQAVTIPLTMTSPILSFLYQPGEIPPLENGLASYWKLDETTGSALDELGTNTLTAANAPGNALGVIQGARTFNGDHQYFSIPTRPSVELANTSFTFTSWVKLDNKSDYHTFVGKRIENYPYYDRDYSLDYDTVMDRFYFQVAGPDGVTLTRAIANNLGSPTLDTWYFLAGGYNYESGYIWISVNDGPKETTAFTGAVHVGQAPFMLGGVANPSFGYHVGVLDEIGFWKRVLTSEELVRLYNNGQGRTYPFGTMVPEGVLDFQVTDGVTTTTIFTTTFDTTDWTYQWFDLTAWKGQAITLTFMLHGTKDLPAQVYLDEVTLGSGYPDTWVQLANPPVARLGSTITYQLTYGNQALVPAYDVQLTATLPAQVTFVAASLPPANMSNSLIWDLGDLAAQSGPHTIFITAAVTSTITSINTLTNTVSISPAASEVERANNFHQTNLHLQYINLLPLILAE
ncbi:hypothetical protein TFLX_00255 [Thermoflexales bacterium]|nr:hypothetical protein TFLX_00255 [Thermoflexales bacterium]